MQRRIFLLLGLLLAAPLVAQANTISLQGTGQLLPNTAGQSVTLVLSGTDAYTASDFFATIDAGGPQVESLFGAASGGLTLAQLAGSVWGQGGIGSVGLNPTASFGTTGFAPQTTNGVYLVLSVSTVGVAPGTYVVNPDGSTMNNGANQDDDPNFIPLTFAPFSLTIAAVPEPSSIVLGLFAAAGLGAVIVRRRRTA